jgi:ferrous iron transport protein B
MRDHGENESRIRFGRPERAPIVAIVGGPNVGKSLMFNQLTGRYVTVSNYPGTTVEVSEGAACFGREHRVVDTPGMYSLLPITEEERVARRILLEDRPRVVLHIVDAKNLDRMAGLTFELLDLGLPVVLVLNMIDEAERHGIRIDAAGLSRALGIPVIETAATTGRGLEALRQAIAEPPSAPAAPVRHQAQVEEAVVKIVRLLPPAFAPAARPVALLLLQGDAELLDAVRAADAAAASEIQAIIQSTTESLGRPIPYVIALARHGRARSLAHAHVRALGGAGRRWADRLSAATINPWTGVPILAAVIYLGLYRFVGVFGAGRVVGWLEKDLFGDRLNPWVNGLLLRALPGSGASYWARELFGGEYGLVTLGVTYAIAIILPIVSLFFLFFAVVEDTGYFPRLALLVDRLFKRIGLNGRAVVPLVLGLGCDTMATMVTRIQETRRERVITTLLLALAVPCSAQYGVITALLAQRPAGLLGVSWAWLAWGGILFAIFLGSGRLASRLLPGEPASFYMELPPLRLPRLSNVTVKTMARMRWYFLEVLPLFLLASALIWVGRLSGAFDALVAGLRPIVRLIGLPAEAATALLYGFFRRDFGAAGLYRIAPHLDGAQLLVACVTLTLFLPCVAQFLIMKKERGLKAATAMAATVFAAAFLVGGTVHAVCRVAGWSP